MPVPKHSETLVTISTVITRKQRDEIATIAAERDRRISHVIRELIQVGLDKIRGGADEPSDRRVS